MGQARKNKVRPSNPQIEVTPRTPTAESGNGKKSSEYSCFDFLLEDCTALAEALQVGESVVGDFAKPRIRMIGPLGVLGYAPENASKRIMRKVSETAGKIVGKVKEFRPPRGVRIEVCI